MSVEHLQVRMQRLISPRLARLSLQRPNLPLHFLNDVADAQQIRFCRFQFAERFFFLRFVFSDSGRFLKNAAPIFRTRTQDQVDLALLHDGVSGATHSSVGEQTVDVLQAATGFVQEIFGIAITVNASRYPHLMPGDPELLRALGEIQRNFGETERLAGLGAVENDISHLAAAERFGRLFTQNPADGVADVGLPAAIGTNNGGHAFVEIKDCFVGERLKAEELERLKMH